MSPQELLENPVSQKEYKRGRASALPPDELEPGTLYTAHLLLGEVARTTRGTGVYAVEALVEVAHVSPDRRLFAVLHYVSPDGQPEGPAYTPDIDEEGLMHGTVAPIATREGYLLNSTGNLEDELRELEEEVLVPVRVIGTTAYPINHHEAA